MNNNTTKNNSELALDFSESVWESEEISNTSTPYLRMTWFAIFEGFTKCMDFNNNNKPAKKIIIPAPTGTGKTLSMCYFMQSLEEHIGALIVVPFIDDANEIVERINRGAGYIKALAFHSGKSNWKTGDDIKDYQVLVITHNLFVGASDRKHNHIGIDRGKLDKLYQYKNSKRDLVVIDESIETIMEAGLEYDHIYYLSNLLNGYRYHKNSNASLHNKIQKEIDIMNRLISFFEVADGSLGGKSEARIDRYMLHNHMDGYDTSFDNIRYLNNSGTFRNINRKLLNTDIKKNISEILEEITAIMGASWLYYTKKGNALRTARDAAPTDTTTVILDATSTIDYHYQIHPNIDFEISKMIPRNQVRDYKNVNLYLSKGQRTGQDKLVKSDSVDEYVEKIWKEVYNPFDEDTKVAVFTFKEIAKKLQSYVDKYECKNIVHLGYFGNLTGKNDYRDCTRIFIVGMPYKPSHITTNVHALSMRGDIECFDEGQEIRSERVKIKNTKIAADLVQAINRAACRRTIDEYGNCPRVDIHMLIPSDQNLAAVITDAIQSNMININIHNWDFVLSAAKKRGPENLNDEAFINEVSNLESSTPYALIAKEIGMTRGPAQNLRNRLIRSDEFDPIVSAIFKYGFIFKRQGKGYWLIKH